jgi:crossover junction endodeoxyribonuclease RuvC
MKKIIGIDPGLSDTGIGIVTGFGLSVSSYSYGTVRTSKAMSLPGRLAKIYASVCTILERENPDLMIVEDIFSLRQYPKSGIVLGKVSGIILLAGHQHGVKIDEIPVREAKQVLTGNGNADKSQLEKAVRKRLKLSEAIRPSHASDALGLALIGLYRSKETVLRHDRLS